MTYSKQFRGLAAVLIAAVAAFPTEHAKEQEAAGVEPSTTKVHQDQLSVVAPEIIDVLSACPGDIQLEVNVWGFGDAADRGKFGWNLALADRATPGPE